MIYLPTPPRKDAQNPRIELSKRTWQMLLLLAERRGITPTSLANYALSQWLERQIAETSDQGHPPADR